MYIFEYSKIYIALYYNDLIYSCLNQIEHLNQILNT